MAIQVKIPEVLSDCDFELRFSPFLGLLSRLPDCSIQVHLLTESAGFFSENPAFSLFLEQIRSGVTPKGTVRVNQYCFAPLVDGVMIWERREAWAWVHHAWKTIDIVLKDDYVRIGDETGPLIHLAPKSGAIQPILMRAFQYTAIYSDAVLMHAAAVLYEKKGILFCGLPSAGKSTQARLWEQTFHAEAINNDQPCIVYENGIAMVSGTPWSGKEPCYRNTCVPVRAIVFVEKSPEDRIEALSRQEAFSRLYLNEYVISLQPDTEAAYEAAIMKLVQSVPVLRQFCTKTTRAPQTLHNYLERRVMEDII